MTNWQNFERCPKDTTDESGEEMIARLIVALAQKQATLGVRVVAVARPCEGNERRPMVTASALSDYLPPRS